MNLLAPATAEPLDQCDGKKEAQHETEQPVVSLMIPDAKIRPARLRDLPYIDRLTNHFSYELGFIPRVSATSLASFRAMPRACGSSPAAASPRSMPTASGSPPAFAASASNAAHAARFSCGPSGCMSQRICSPARSCRRSRSDRTPANPAGGNARTHAAQKDNSGNSAPAACGRKIRPWVVHPKPNDTPDHTVAWAGRALPFGSFFDPARPAPWVFLNVELKALSRRHG